MGGYSSQSENASEPCEEASPWLQSKTGETGPIQATRSPRHRRAEAEEVYPGQDPVRETAGECHSLATASTKKDLS